MHRKIFSEFSFSGKARTIAAFSLLAFGLLASLPPLFLPVDNPDIYWHFSAARWILAHHRLPTADFLSWTQSGKPWTDFEWLTQLIFYLVYKAGSFRALVFLKAAVISAALYFFAKLMRLYGLQSLLFAAIPFWMAGLWPYLDVRPDNFTLAFFAAELYWLEKFRLRGSSTGLSRLLGAVFIFFALWANLHAGFVYGLLLLGIYSLGEFIPAALPAVYGRGGFLPLDKTRKLLACLGAGAAGTFFNAYGYKIYQVLFQHMSFMGELQETILEWQPATIYLREQRLYWALTAAVFAVMLRRFIKTRELPYAQLLAVSYFSLTAASHGRHIPFMMLTALPFTFHLLSLEEWRGLKLHAARAAAAVLLLLALNQLKAGYSWPPGEKPWEGELAPRGVTEFLRLNSSELSRLRMLNPWGWGGYMGYILAPDYRVFVDGRYIFHPYLKTVLAMKDRAAWDKALSENRWQLVVMEAAPNYYLITKNRGRIPGRARLLPPEHNRTLPIRDWAMVYWDAQALVFVKRNSADKKWLTEHEFTALRSGELVFAGGETLKGRYAAETIKKEVIRYLKGPHGIGGYNMGYEVGEWHRTIIQALKEKFTKKTH